MKRILTAALAAMTVISMTACGNAANKPQGANRLEEIQSKGYIEVATEPYFAPFEFIDPAKSGDDKYVGVDIEIARVIADKLGVELRVVPLEFSAVLAGITEGKYDLALSALAYSPQRAESMNMSDGYFFEEGEGYGLLVRAEDAAKYSTAESLADAVMVTQSGSVQEAMVTAQIPNNKEFKRVSSMTDGFLMVGEGKADACAADVANAKLYMAANPDAGLAIAEGFRFTVSKEMEGTRAGIPKGEEELTAVVNEVIAELNKSGQIAKWYEEYAEYAKKLGIQ